MKTDTLITRRQLMALAFVGILSPVTRLLPGAPASFAGHAAWLTPLAAIPVCVIYFRMLGDMTAMRRDGQGMCELLNEAWGRRLGGAAGIVVALWLVFYIGFTVRTASERFLSAVYITGNTWRFSLLLVIMATIAARGTLRSLARSAQIFAILGGVILVPLLFLAAISIKTEYLLPVTVYDLPEILLGAVPIINLICCYGYFTFIYGGTHRRDSDEGVTIRWLLLAIAVVFLIVFTTIGSLSAPLCVRLQSPFFIMIRNITLLGVAERVEALVLGLWVITDFAFLAGQMIISSHILGVYCSRLRRQDWCLVIGAVSLGISFLLGSSAFDLRALSFWIVPGANLALTMIMLPCAWATLKIKRAVRRKKIKD